MRKTFDRQAVSLGTIFTAIPLSIAGVNAFEGDRWMQSAVMAAYALVVIGVATWANRSRKPRA